MLVDPLPTVHNRFTKAEFDEAETFPSPKILEVAGGPNATLAGVVYAVGYLDGIATAIEQCFAATNGPTLIIGFQVPNGGPKVEVVYDAANQPTGIKVAAAVFTLGEAISLADQIRKYGFGTPYVP